MAKTSRSSLVSKKLSFGKRKCGLAKKSYNKHTPKPKASRGHGK